MLCLLESEEDAESGGRDKQGVGAMSEKLLLHMLEYTILFLGEYQRRLRQLDELLKTDPIITQEKINQLAGDSIRILKIIEPCLPYAIEKFPEFKDFLVSCSDTVAKIKKDNAIDNKCECRGCK